MNSVVRGRRCGVGAGAGVAALAVLAGAGKAQVDWRAVAMAGQGAPGLTGVTFDAVSDPKLGPAGKVAFWAKLTGTGVTTSNSESLWTDRAGPVALAYRSGIPAPGTAGVLGGMAGFAYTGNGLLAFAGSVVEGTATAENIAYFAETAPGTLVLKARDAVSTTVFTFPTLVPVNRTGDMAWSTSTGLASSTGINLTTATPLPGGGTGVTFRRFSEPTFTELGVGIFRGFYGATTTGTDWQQGLFTVSGTGGPLAIALQGNAVPNMPIGTVFVEFGGSPMARTGNATAAVYDWIKVQDQTPLVRSGIFRAIGGDLTPLVLSGDVVSGLNGVRVGAISRRFAITPSGGVAFHAILTGTTTPGVDNAAILIKDDGQPLRVVVRRGQRLGNMPPGSVLDVIGEPRVSTSGHLVFAGQIKGGGASGQALFSSQAVTQSVPPRMLLRAGELLAAPGQPVRTVRSISFDTETEEVGHSQVAGRTLAVTLTFEDRASGVFTGTLACTSDFDGDTDVGTDADIEAFFACLGGNCCATCATADFNGDGNSGTDADIEAFFRVLAGGNC